MVLNEIRKGNDYCDWRAISQPQSGPNAVVAVWSTQKVALMVKQMLDNKQFDNDTLAVGSTEMS